MCNQLHYINFHFRKYILILITPTIQMKSEKLLRRPSKWCLPTYNEQSPFSTLLKFNCDEGNEHLIGFIL